MIHAWAALGILFATLELAAYYHHFPQEGPGRTVPQQIGWALGNAVLIGLLLILAPVLIVLRTIAAGRWLQNKIGKD